MEISTIRPVYPDLPFLPITLMLHLLLKDSPRLVRLNLFFLFSVVLCFLSSDLHLFSSTFLSWLPSKSEAQGFSSKTQWKKRDLAICCLDSRMAPTGKTVWTLFLMKLYTFLWSLLLIIPGIVKSYEYRMVPYLLADCPDLSTEDAFRISREMMDGEKMNAFILDLSFIGWKILSSITLRSCRSLLCESV